MFQRCEGIYKQNWRHIMHTKFGLNKPDFDKLVENQEYANLAEHLKNTLNLGKIKSGEYESCLEWLEKSAQMVGKSIKN